MKARFKMFLAAAAHSTCGTAQADITVQMNIVDEKGIGESVGEVVISETQYGVIFSPSLVGLPPGLHGFHVHENPNCEPKDKDGKMVAALAAGGHYDPASTKRLTKSSDNITSGLRQSSHCPLAARIAWFCPAAKPIFWLL